MGICSCPQFLELKIGWNNLQDFNRISLYLGKSLPGNASFNSEQYEQYRGDLAISGPVAFAERDTRNVAKL